MADKWPSLMSKAPKAHLPASQPTTTSRPATRSAAKVKKDVLDCTEDDNTHNDAHEDHQQEDLINKPNSRHTKGKSQAGTKKRPRDQTVSESECEDGHKRQGMRTKTVRMEEIGPVEEERTEERVRVGPPKGNFPILSRYLASDSTAYCYLHMPLPSSFSHPFILSGTINTALSCEV